MGWMFTAVKEGRLSWSILIRKVEGKRPFGRPQVLWTNTIEV